MSFARRDPVEGRGRIRGRSELKMAILLKDLTARAPGERDLAALEELVQSCEEADGSHELAGRFAAWQKAEVSGESTAWLISTRTGQVVGLAACWVDQPGHCAPLLCVHPAF